MCGTSWIEILAVPPSRALKLAKIMPASLRETWFSLDDHLASSLGGDIKNLIGILQDLIKNSTWGMILLYMYNRKTFRHRKH